MKPFTVIFRKIDDIPKFFSKYPFYKLYEESDNYIDDEFNHDYGDGIHTYKYVIYVINDTEWIAAEECLTKDDREELKAHCQCELCQKYFFNIVRWTTCPHCYGCLKYSSATKQEIIHDTRAYIKSLEDKRSFLGSINGYFCSIP